MITHCANSYKSLIYYRLHNAWYASLCRRHPSNWFVFTKCKKVGICEPLIMLSTLNTVYSWARYTLSIYDRFPRQLNTKWCILIIHIEGSQFDSLFVFGRCIVLVQWKHSLDWAARLCDRSEHLKYAVHNCFCINWVVKLKPWTNSCPLFCCLIFVFLWVTMYFNFQEECVRLHMTNSLIEIWIVLPFWYCFDSIWLLSPVSSICFCYQEDHHSMNHLEPNGSPFLILLSSLEPYLACLLFCDPTLLPFILQFLFCYLKEKCHL